MGGDFDMENDQYEPFDTGISPIEITHNDYSIGETRVSKDDNLRAIFTTKSGPFFWRVPDVSGRLVVLRFSRVPS